MMTKTFRIPVVITSWFVAVLDKTLSLSWIGVVGRAPDYDVRVVADEALYYIHPFVSFFLPLYSKASPAKVMSDYGDDNAPPPPPSGGGGGGGGGGERKGPPNIDGMHVSLWKVVRNLPRVHALREATGAAGVNEERLNGMWSAIVIIRDMRHPRTRLHVFGSDCSSRDCRDA